MKRKDTATPLRKVSTPATAAAPTMSELEKLDVEILDITALSSAVDGEETSSVFKKHPGDEDPLLKSRVPPMPSATEIVALIAAPPLGYLEARAKLADEAANYGAMKPPRKFCEICGYWGRVRCRGCGSRVCALECLRAHQEECYTRYGA